MKYIASTTFNHKQSLKTGILLVNLGTPDAPDAPSLRRYLKEFLSDPRVVEMPRLIWWMILNGIILNIRPKRSAKAYQSVWTEQGSPLRIHLEEQTRQLINRYESALGDSITNRCIEIDYAMRYGQPSVDSVLQKMMHAGVNKIIVLPLYPQYSAATTGSTFDAIAKTLTRFRQVPELHFISHYHDHPAFIQAIGNKIKRYWQQSGKAQKLIFSYHGIPKRYFDNGDPYHCECYKTSRLIAEYLELNEDEYMTTFQSRFGREEWLKPYTDETLKLLPQQGVKSVQMVCPGFSADCLETIEEIGIENRGYFMDAGGEQYEYIEALNSDLDHIEMMYQLTSNYIGDTLNQQDVLMRSQQALKFGAEK
ncbi:ferrochelatase [Aliikangiella maris]